MENWWLEDDSFSFMVPFQGQNYVYNESKPEKNSRVLLLILESVFSVHSRVDIFLREFREDQTPGIHG